MNLTVPVSRQALQPTDCWVLPPDDKYQVSQDRFLSMWSLLFERGKVMKSNIHPFPFHQTQRLSCLPSRSNLTAPWR